MLFQTLFGLGKPKLTSLEQHLIAILTDALSPVAAKLLGKQLNQINLVQRHSQGKEVNLYARRGKQIKFDDATLFSLKSEAKLATIKFCCFAIDEPITVEIWIVEGHIFSLEFDRSPRICGEVGIEELNIIVHVDPLCETIEALENQAQYTKNVQKSPSVSQSQDILDKFRSLFDVHDILPPVAQEERKNFIELLRCSVPDDYVQLLRETNGFSVGGWRFYGTNPRRILLPNVNYQIIAEDNMSIRSLCFREGETIPQVFAYDQIDDDLLAGGDSFVEAFVQQLSTN